jgi:hypothetical protein
VPLLLASPAEAQLLGIERVLPQPKTDYTAAVVVSDNGVQAEGRVFRAPNKERREFTIEGESRIVIVRLDTKRVWSLVPEEKIFIETSYDEALGRAPSRAGATPVAKAKVALTPLGHEPVNGVAALKERVAGEDEEGRPIAAIVWISPQGIVLRVDTELRDDQGARHQVRMELHDLKPGPQDSKLFEIPPDYRPAGQTRTGALAPREAGPPRLARN